MGVFPFLKELLSDKWFNVIVDTGGVSVCWLRVVCRFDYLYLYFFFLYLCASSLS